MSKIKGKAIIMLLVFITIFNVLNIANFAIWAKESEIEDILNQIPERMNLEIKEIEFKKAPDLVKKEIEQIPGMNRFRIECTWGFWLAEDKIIDFQAVYWHEITVRIYEGEKWLKQKTIKVHYSDSDKWKKEDYDYLQKDVIGGGIREKRWEYEINLDGTFEKPEHTEIIWKDFFKEDTGGSDDTIQHIGKKTGTFSVDFNVEGYMYDVLILKDGIIYDCINVHEYDIPRITVPNEINETDEEYINYAKPIIETWKKGEKVKNLQREVFEAPGFVSYTIETDTKFTYELESGKTGKIVIAKENEYRGRPIVNIKDIITQKENGRVYLKADIWTREIIGSHNARRSLGKYLPTITLIDKSGKGHLAKVDKKSDNIYEFKLDVTGLEIETLYLQSTNPNNRLLEKNAILPFKNEIYISDSDINKVMQNIKDYTVVMFDIKEPMIINKEILRKLKESKKAELSLFEEINEELTTVAWRFKSEEIINENIEFNPIVQVFTEKPDSIMSNDITNGVFIDFKHNGDLPGIANVSMDIGTEKFGEGRKTLELYYYNEQTSKYEYSQDIEYDNRMV